MKRLREQAENRATLDQALTDLTDALKAIQSTDAGIAEWPEDASMKAAAACSAIANVPPQVFRRTLSDVLHNAKRHPYSGQPILPSRIGLDSVPKSLRDSQAALIDADKYLVYLFNLCDAGTYAGAGADDIPTLLLAIYCNYGLADLIAVSLVLEKFTEKPDHAVLFKRMVACIFNYHCTNQPTDDLTAYNCFISGTVGTPAVLRSMYIPHRMIFNDAVGILPYTVTDAPTRSGYICLHCPPARVEGRPKLRHVLPLRVYGQGPMVPPANTPAIIPSGTYHIILQDSYAHYLPANKPIPIPTDVKTLFKECITVRTRSVCRFDAEVVISSIRHLHRFRDIATHCWLCPYDDDSDRYRPAPEIVSVALPRVIPAELVESDDSEAESVVVYESNSDSDE